MKFGDVYAYVTRDLMADTFVHLKFGRCPNVFIHCTAGLETFVNLFPAKDL